MGSVNLLPNLRSGCGVHVNDVPAFSSLRRCARRALRGARSGRPRADHAAEALLPRGARRPARAGRRRRPRASRRSARSTSTSTTSCRSPRKVLAGRRHHREVLAPFQEEGTGPFTLRLSEVQKPDEHARRRRRWSRGSRSSSRRGGRRRRSGCASRAAASSTPALPVYAHYVFAGKVAQVGPARRCPRARAGRSTSSASSSRSRRARAGASGRSSSISTRSYDPKAAVRVPMTIRVRTMAKQDR